MNPILPTAPSLPQGQPVTPVGQILATLTQLPTGSLNNLLVGALLSGTVIGRDSKGQILLQTGQGVFGIKTATPLPVGSNVTFEVQSAGAQLQTVLLSVTAPGTPRLQAAATPAVYGPVVPETPVPPPMPGAAQSSGAGVQPASGGATPATTNASPATTVTATVIAPPGGNVTPAQATPAAAGTPPQAAPAASVTSSVVPNAMQPSDDLPGSTAVLARPVPTSPVPEAVAAPRPATSQPLAAPATATTTAGVATLPETQPAPALTLPSARATPIPTPPAPANVAAPPSLMSEPASVPALPTGTQVQVRVLPEGQPAANTPAGLMLGASAQTPAATTVAATIVGRTPQGQTIVETPLGRLAMALPATANETLPGKVLTIELGAIARPANPEPPPLAQRHSAMSITREWPALKAAMASAEDGNDHMLRRALDEAVPRPGPRLAQQLLQAVAGGDTRQALIESVVRPLERAGFAELAQRIEHDLQDLQKLGSAPGADWRLSFVPFFDGQEVRQLRIFSRKKKNDPTRKGNAGTRFVIECEHGELGPLQLDGFLQKQALDVIVRSHADLPAWMKGDMIALFTDACGAIGMTGRLQFNAMPTFPISPMDEIAGAGSGVLV